MKNILKHLITVFFIINVLVLDFCLIKGKINITKGIDILQGVVAVLNLLIIIGFYFKDSHKNEINQKNSIKHYWYHDLIIGKNIDNVENMYNRIVIGVKFESNDYKEMKVQLRNIKEPIVEVRNSLSPLLNAFNENFNKQIMDKLMELEDITTNTFVNVITENISEKEYIERVKKHQGELYSIMFEFDINIS